MVESSNRKEPAVRDIDPIEGDALPALPKQPCSICDKPLSIYNKTGKCFHHSELDRPPQIQEELRAPESTLGATGEERRGPPSPKFLMTLVCQKFGISQNQILAPLRKAPVVKARQVLMYLLHNDTPLSYPEIGQFLGGKDRVTVMYGVRKIDSIVETDPTVKRRIGKIRSYYGKSSEEG